MPKMAFNELKSTQSMFKGCESLESLDLSTCGIESVQVMRSMFEGCSSLQSIDFGGRVASSVKDTTAMFKGCISLEQMDLAWLGMSSLQSVQSMFSDCSSLQSIEFHEAKAPNLTALDNMFSGCRSLESIDLSMIDTTTEAGGNTEITGVGGLFDMCVSLESVDLSGKFGLPPKTFLNYVDMFRGCFNLCEIRLGEKIHGIGPLPSYEVYGHRNWYSSRDKLWYEGKEVPEKRKGKYGDSSWSADILTKWSNSMSDCTVEVEPTSYTYTGASIVPFLHVSSGPFLLAEGEDYTVAYKDNVNAGEATIILTGVGDYAGEKRISFEIIPASIEGVEVSLEPTSFVYDGKPKEPAVSAFVSGGMLVNGVDYDVQYKDNIEAGTATAVLIGKGNYRGTSLATFTIMEPDRKEAKVSRIWGKTALDTMSAIVHVGNFEKGGTLLVATSGGYWDALSASGYAGLAEAPVVLTDGEVLSPQTCEVISQVAPSRVIVCGGPKAISITVEGQIRKVAQGAFVDRVWGENAIETANRLVVRGAEDTGYGYTDSAFLATTEGYWDALAAAPVAYALHAPVLLVDPTKGIDESTVEVMEMLGIVNVYIVGGEKALSADLESQVKAAGLSVSGRFAGADACETSLRVAMFGVSRGLTADGLGLATSEGYWDALCGAPLCGDSKGVIILASDSNRSAIDGMAKSYAGEIELIRVFGGESAVSKETYEYVKKAFNW